MNSSHAHLLALPYDVRRLIYDFFYPVGKHIHLTSGPVTEYLIRRKIIVEPKSYRFSNAGGQLLRVCRQINEEASMLIYGKNTFFLIPNESLALQPLRISSLWLYHLRKPTRQMIKKLDIHIDLPFSRSYIAGMLLNGVAEIPVMEITIVQTAWLTRREHLRQREELFNLLKGIMKVRVSLTTVWSDLSDIYTLDAMQEVGIIKTTSEWRQRLARTLPYIYSIADSGRSQEYRKARGETLMLADEAMNDPVKVC